jgi:hypothetical protein
MIGMGMVLLYFAMAAAAAAIILQSDQYVVRRSATIAADARRLFTLVSDPARWTRLGPATVVESAPDERVVLRLDSGKAERFLIFGLKREGGATLVDGIMTGRNSLADKVRNLFSGRDKALGPEIEKALADLAASA